MRYVLIPTQFERNLFRQHGLDAMPENWRIATCGFGMIASGIETARLLASHSVEGVILTGIAGVYGNELAIGEAAWFSSVSCYGIGVGSRNEFQSAASLGWQSDPHASDTLPLIAHESHTSAGELLSCCAASANEADRNDRIRLFPNAIAEEMEGFAVAWACLRADVPLSIVRGISNIAGCRDKSQWRIKEAIASAAQIVSQTIHKI